MLRDQNHRINTTSLAHGKISPSQRRIRAAVITSFKAILLHRVTSIFRDIETIGPRPVVPRQRATLAHRRAERYQ
jgi:hypothetical protein